MSTGGNFILGQGNTADSLTSLGTSKLFSGPALEVDNVYADGINGTGVGTGVTGVATTNDVKSKGTGVLGQGTAFGVVGHGAADGVGVHGQAPFLGVVGRSTNTTVGRTVAGVLGEADSDMGVGVQGQSKGSMGAGVSGLATTGIGVSGQSPTGTGVNGQSTTGIGVFGLTQASSGISGAAGVVGQCLGGMAPGVVGVGDVAAGWFFGDVVVIGNAVVTGRKNAAVPFPDGSHRGLYCVESPESWFEDFGTARLVRGRAKVLLDPAFAAVVQRGQLHVFLTPAGECRGLFVHRQSRNGFEVRELQGGKATVRFSYRVVARRKDVTAKRFERVTVPALPKGVGPIRSREPIELPTSPERARSRTRKRRMVRNHRRARARRQRR